MHYVNKETSLHDWEKANFLKLEKAGRLFDEMECFKCGIKGRHYEGDIIEVTERFKSENAHGCLKAEKPSKRKRVRIIKCNDLSFQFKELKPNTVHSIINPPRGYCGVMSGVWVMGIDEPVKLEKGEFELLK